jgi:hypothetical protein
MAENLLRELLLPGVDETELLFLLERIYGSDGVDSDGGVVFPSSMDYALKIRTDAVQIRAIERGPALTAADVDKIRERVRSDLIESPETIVAVGILFSKHPVIGMYRHGNVIQILPAPANAPRAGVELSDHAFLLEYAIKRSRDDVITNTRRTRGVMEWGWVLNALLRTGVRFILPRARFMWAGWAHMPGLQELHPSLWVQEGYVIPDLTIERPDFSSTETSAMCTLPDQDYYTKYVLGAQEMIIPESLPRLVDAIITLSPDDRRRFMRAVKWFYAAGEVWENNTSSAFQAVSSAVEALMPPQGPPDLCPTCGKDRGPGPTRRFREFIDSFAPLAPGAKRAPLYETGSGLRHGDLLLYLDELPWSYFPSAKSVGQRETFYEFHRTARQVLANWLLQGRLATPGL